MTEGIFLYYIPGKKWEDVTPADLAANPILAGPFFDLIHSPRLFKTKRIGCTVVNKGPDNGDGAIVAVQPECERNQPTPHYNANTQTWRKLGEQWIGWQTDMLPGPEGLRRPTQISGYEVELGDGNIWIAPTIRAYQESSSKWASTLPMAWGVNENMQAVGEPLAKFRAVWEMSAEIWASVYAGQTATMSDCFGWAANSLGLNYRVGVIEASLLGLFTDDTMKSVIHAAVDAPLVDAVTEKKSKVSENPTLPAAGTNT